MTQRWLHQQFAHAADSAPQSLAIIAGDQRLSYAGLACASDTAAAQLAARGIGPGDVVALYFEPSAEHIICMLAVLKSGAAWLSLDAGWPKSRLVEILQRVQPALLVAGDAPVSGGVSADELSVTVSLKYSALIEGEAGPPPQPQISDDDLCYLMFTSGSTGRPNGVQVTYANVAGLIENVRDELRITPQDNWSALHSAAFGFSLWEIWGALTTGGTLVIVPEAQRSDPWAWDAKVRNSQVSVLSLTPSGLRQWLAADLPVGCGNLRLVVLSGEELRPGDMAGWTQRFGSDAPRVVNTYALTETAGRVAIADVAPEQPSALLGVATTDAELLLLDSESMQPVAEGNVGELFIGGPIVARGYLDDAALTAERFIRLDPGDGNCRRFYRSGDLARRLPDGQLLFARRADAQIKLHGHRIEPADIEAALQAHPEIEAAAVVAVDDGASHSLYAFAVPRAGVATDGPEFWPSLGEYQIYDDLLYDFMSADEVRVESYRRAFEKFAPGKTVLDIGTGKDALLARLAATCGARHVYAVEVLPDAAASAARLVTQLGLQDRITVICGDMNSVQLPEPVDLCTQGIVGNIGSSDGIVAIWNGARKFFGPDTVAVPSRCTTFIAPASLPAALRDNASFGPLAADYAQRVFAAEGREFDVRLCVRNFSSECLLAEPVIFEQLDFGDELSPDYDGQAHFSCLKAGWFDGYLLWTRIDNDSRDSVDFFDHQKAWLPVWFPLDGEPVYLERGAEVNVRWRCETPEGQIFPDYRVETDLDLPRVHSSRHHQQTRGSTALHRSLLASLSDVQKIPAAGELRDWLAGCLPAYMVPAAVGLISHLPLNNSRKLDRRALRERARQMRIAASTERPAAAMDEFTQRIAALWADVLGVQAIGPETHFFDAGGDSISAVRLTTEVQRLLDDAVFLAVLFEAPTLDTYCKRLTELHGNAVRKCLAESPDDTDHADASANLLVTDSKDPAPLAWAQQSLWFLQQLYPDNTAANEQFLIRLHEVDPELLAAAWAELLERHAVFSTRFDSRVSELAGADSLVSTVEPMQRMDAGIGQRIGELADRLDFSRNEQPEEDLCKLAGQEILRSFDLRAGGLLRPVLVRLSRTDYALLVTAHHIIADGLCVPLIRDELFALYKKAAVNPGADQDVATTEPKAQFADFARWQRDQFQGVGLEEELDWWRRQLAGVNTEPVTATRPQVSSAGPETRIAFSFDTQTSQALRELAQAQGVSLFVTLLTVWRAWLARCFDRDDFLLGSPVTQRTSAQTSRMLGCMVNNVAFRNALDLNAGFITALQAERDQVLASLDHSALPFEKIVEDLQPERSFGRHPLFQFMFQYEERAPDVLGTNGEVFSIDVLPVNRASYWDLELAVTDPGEQAALQCFLGVRDDLFDSTALTGWKQGLQAFVQALLDDPRQALAQLPMLSVQQLADRAAVNATTMPVPESSLYEMFAVQAERSPDATAVSSGAWQCSYAELLERVRQCARALQAAGVAAGDTVGVHLPRGDRAIILLMAINYRGATWLALDPEYPETRLQRMLAEVNPRLLVSDAKSTDAMAESMGIPVMAWQALQELQHDQPLPQPEIARQLCLLFTSGSTGEPKGVALTQRAAVSRCVWMWQEFGFGRSRSGKAIVNGPVEIFGHRTSLNFVDAIWEIFGALIHGAQVDVAPQAAQKDMRLQAQWLAGSGITHAVVFPSALSLMLDCWAEAPPEKLHTLIVTGEAVPLDMLQVFKHTLPRCRLINTYGTTENWDIAASSLHDRDDLSVVPAGFPVANAHVHVLDRFGQPLPAGAAGRLYAGGLGVGEGYLNRPDLTAERFSSGSRDLPDKLFYTGDLASFNVAGELVLHGRSDRQLKLRGVRIEPAEIESLVNRQSGVVQSAVVLGGEGAINNWLTLYVVPETSSLSDLTEDHLRRILSANLPASVIPADIVFTDAIPRTGSGKIDVRALRHQAPVAAAGNEQPANATETVLCEIWEQALGTTGIGRHDDFFAARGNSLLATRVIARICDRFNLDLPLACIFESPTVAELARIIDVMQWAESDAASQLSGDHDDDPREVVRL